MRVQCKKTCLAGLWRGLLARRSQRLEAFAIFVKRLLRGLMLAHRLLGVGAPQGVAGLAFFGGERFRGTDGILFCHGHITSETSKGSRRFVHAGCDLPPL